MKTIDYNELLELAQSYSKNNIPWHHHFLTPKCMFNQEGKFQIILENEQTSESFVCHFDEKPMKKLEDLENIFFNKKSHSNNI
jgi:hypothetical protein